MYQLPEALKSFDNYKQFILWELVPRGEDKTDKLPCDYRTGKRFTKEQDWQNDPLTQSDFNSVLEANKHYPKLHIGYLFTKQDPFFFLDIDNCLQTDNTWSPTAITLINLLPGAAIEVSQSGTGLHIFGTGFVPDHGCKNKDLNIELYTESRICALTGNNIIGNATTDCSVKLPSIVSTYFPPKISVRGTEWTTTPLPEWTSPGDNEALINKALATSSMSAKFGNAATFRDLWEDNTEVLINIYPKRTKISKHVYDQSDADMALAQHLAFWTGCNCEHMLQLMWCSGLVREKWAYHKEYLTGFTIPRAVSLQNVVYTAGGDKTVDNNIKLKKLKGTVKQIEYADKIRIQKLEDCGYDERLMVKHGPVLNAGFWIDNKDLSSQQLINRVSGVESNLIIEGDDEPQIMEGYQFLPVSRQIEHFKGCTYVQDVHSVFTPTGMLLKTEQFNVMYGGHVFQLDGEASGKTTKKAWEAFTESQVVRYQKAETTCFRPLETPGKRIKEEGRILVNTYTPVETKRIKGDITPFLIHLNKILPDKHDADILLAYLSALIQHKGCKFQWTPLIQGMPGNGKTLFTRCINYAIGKKYIHLPFAKEIAEKHNDWLFDKLFIGVNDVYVPEHKSETIETLKPMISEPELAKRAMQRSQIMSDVCANFLLNANDKASIKIVRVDRRFAPFYTAQQTLEDLKRDGMDGNYFPELYKWLRKEGYAIVNDYLNTYTIPVELNPALEIGGLAERAPITTSTDEAFITSIGSIEQEIIEAVEQGKMGFSGGWVSSMAVERLFRALNATRKIPPNKRRELMQSIGYDWHPGLKSGRVTTFIPEDGGKPKLFVKIGHISSNLTSQPEIIKAYQNAQQYSTPFSANKYDNQY